MDTFDFGDFKFDGKIIRPRKLKLERSVRVPVIKSQEDLPPYFIRGRQADSKDEYWSSLALEKIAELTGWGWAYQVPVYGGRMGHGLGNVVDFLIYTPGPWTMLDPMGRYWHTGRHEDRRQMEEVARRKHWRLIAWFTDDPQWNTREKVYTSLRKELHV
jgi:hypothetical protein